MSNTTKKQRDPAWFAADRKFFERHPDREYRFRRARRDELPEGIEPLKPGHLWGVVVTQVEPGARIRQLYQMDRRASVYCHMWSDLDCAMAEPQGWLSIPLDVAKAMSDQRVQR